MAPKKKTKRSLPKTKRRNRSTPLPVPTDGDYKISNLILRGASTREAGEEFGVSRQRAWTIQQKVEKYERQQAVDDRLQIKRNATQRLRRMMFMASSLVESQFVALQVAIRHVDERIEEGDVSTEDLTMLAGQGVDMKALKEYREIDRELRDLWGVTAATMPEDSQRVAPSHMTDEEFEKSQADEREQRARVIRMRKNLQGMKDGAA